ncbi:MAG: OadG family protein [Clostridia bacterium]|nr:OadG family protein [Clostridia bacterium]
MNMLRLAADVNMDSVMNNGMTWGEKFAESGRMILIVMAFVFSVIFLIWLSQTIISFVIVKLSSLERKKEAAPVPVPTQPEVIPEPAVPATDDGVTVAVITAAISAYLAAESENGEVKPFRVVSFKRAKQGNKPWNS